MSQPVDELFGEGQGAPQPRISLVLILMGSGLLLMVLGLGCSMLPGAALVMVSWLTIEKEMDRVENGYLPLDARPVVVRMRNATRAVVLATVILLVVQIVLVQSGLYDPAISAFFQTVPSPFPPPLTPDTPAP